MKVELRKDDFSEQFSKDQKALGSNMMQTMQKQTAALEQLL